MMKPSRSANEILSEEYLTVRAKIIEIGAVLDRLDLADGDVIDHSQYKLLQAAIDLLKGQSPDRAETIQRLMSREYDDNWPAEYGLEIER